MIEFADCASKKYFLWITFIWNLFCKNPTHSSHYLIFFLSIIMCLIILFFSGTISQSSVVAYQLTVNLKLLYAIELCLVWELWNWLLWIACKCEFNIGVILNILNIISNQPLLPGVVNFELVWLILLVMYLCGFAKICCYWHPTKFYCMPILAKINFENCIALY